MKDAWPTTKRYNCVLITVVILLSFKVSPPVFLSSVSHQNLLIFYSKGIKIVLDFIPNHTSDKHKWFIESSQGNSTNKYRDYYVWEDGKGGGPPNNWVSLFMKSSCINRIVHYGSCTVVVSEPGVQSFN
jgi:hypothetical protein